MHYNRINQYINLFSINNIQSIINNIMIIIIIITITITITITIIITITITKYYYYYFRFIDPTVLQILLQMRKEKKCKISGGIKMT